MRAIGVMVLAVALFCAATAMAYAFAASLERANGGCQNFFQWCDHPVTIGVSLAAGALAFVLTFVFVPMQPGPPNE